MNTKANFFIVGAAKCGTTSLFHYLPQHKDAFFPHNVKEPAFFAFKYLKFPMKRDHPTSQLTIDNWWGVTTLDEYNNLYKPGKDSKILGDVSIEYLAIPETAQCIKEYNPNAKIFISLRNPVDRAYSHYMQNIRDDFETLTFEEAITEEVEEKRKSENYAYRYWYKAMGEYYNQVKTFIDVFGRENVMIRLHEDLLEDIDSVLNDICQFTGIESIEFETGSNFNLSGRVKNRFLHNLFNTDGIIKTIIRPFLPSKIRHKIVHKFNKKNIVKDPMSDNARNYLKEYFREDIIKLSSLIDRDLSHWL